MKHTITLTTAEAVDFIKHHRAINSAISYNDIEVVFTDRHDDVVDLFSDKACADILDAIANGRNSAAVGLYSKLKNISHADATTAVQSLIKKYFLRFVGYGHENAKFDRPVHLS